MLNNIDEMYKFLEIHKISQLTQEEIQSEKTYNK